jgi:hypothetical protein
VSQGGRSKGVRVIMDIFRSRDVGGWGKARWLVFVIVLPFLGVGGRGGAGRRQVAVLRAGRPGPGLPGFGAPAAGALVRVRGTVAAPSPSARSIRAVSAGGR